MPASASDKALDHITKWIKRAEWHEPLEYLLEEHLGPVCDDLDIDPEDLPDEIGADLYGAALSCVFDDFLTRTFEPGGRNPIDDYLKRRGWKESAPGKRYLQALRQSVMSFYEVTDAVPGSHLCLKDLIRGGEPIRVDDRALSRIALKWDRIAARLLRVGGKTMLAQGLLNFPIEEADDLLGALRNTLARVQEEIGQIAEEEGAGEAHDESEVTEIVLERISPTIIRSWLNGVLDAVSAAVPELRNTEGDEIAFCELRFPVQCANEAEVERRLDARGELERDDGTMPRWQWLQTADEIEVEAVAVEGGEVGDVGDFEEGGTTVLGLIELRGGELVLSANSRKRAERGRQRLSDLLDGLVGPPSLSERDLASMLSDSTVPPEPPGESLTAPTDDVTQVIHEHLDAYYRDLMTTKIPALDEKSPHQARRSKSGRAKLATWLKSLENNEARRARDLGEQPYDFMWMWEELDLVDLRR